MIRVLVVRTPISSISFQEQHTWYLALNRLYKSEVRGSVSRVKTPCEQGLPYCTYVLQAEQRLPHATEKAKRSFSMARGPTAKHHPAWNPQCTQRFRAEVFPLLCPTPKVMPRFIMSVMLEKRGARCRTDGPTRVLSCQIRHMMAAVKAAWCRSLC